MKKQKANAQKVRNLSFERCVICNEWMYRERKIQTNEGLVIVSVCPEHNRKSAHDILNVIYNNAEKMI